MRDENVKTEAELNSLISRKKEIGNAEESAISQAENPYDDFNALIAEEEQRKRAEVSVDNRSFYV